MTVYNYRNIHVKGHYRTYRIGSYPGPYEDIKKWIEPHPRKIKTLRIITQKENVMKHMSYSKLMIKEIPENLIEGIKKLAKDEEHEYSIDIDFERRDEVPQQMLIMKGGRKSTTKVGDFELFGHTHPNQAYPQPSNTDLRILYPLRPEFIVAGKTGKAIIMNIENYDKWRQWKNSGKDVRTDFVDVEWGRERLFKNTGVSVYPMTKNIKVELIDDPHYEKKFPRASPTLIEKWHSK